MPSSMAMPVLLRYVLDRQTATLFVAVGTVALTAWLYIIIPKGFFPVQDTGLIQGITEAPQWISFPAMAERQRSLAAVILKDPDVANLSSFIGVDGTNITLNSGRLLINLKPHEERTADISTIVRRITKATESVEGISLYLQPVQDLTIDDRREPHPISILDGGRRIRRARSLGASPRRQAQFDAAVLQVSSDIAAYGLTAYVDIDRDTAGRFGITPATIDNALYDSFGQRIVSTIFTNSNQYRVILETDPKLQASLDSFDAIYVPTSTGTGRCPCRSSRRCAKPFRLAHRPSGSVSVDLDFLQSGARRLIGRSRRWDTSGTARDRSSSQRQHQIAGRSARLPKVPLQRVC